MAGLYVHIPFCRSRCVYCGFYSTTALELRQRYVDALCREVDLRGQKADTIYIGGGTPSQLTIPQLSQLFISLAPCLSPHAAKMEITLECNPDDITEPFVEGLQSLPVNRISMGAQTFDDQRLKFLHRRHTASQVARAVELLRKAAIRNICIDLMYGFPGETPEDWNSDISRALALDVEHISAYCLMIEEGTVLYEKMRNGENEALRECDEETERSMYELLIDRLTAAGYEHYEISNFARPGFRSRHNSSYWTGVPYVGIGAAAHSYDIRSRSWNVSDIRQYIEGMEHGQRIFEEELLDDNTRYNDAVTIGLRTCEGLDLRSLPNRHRNYCLKNARTFIDNGLLVMTPDLHLHLTRQGLFVSDMVMSELMFI